MKEALIFHVIGFLCQFYADIQSFFLCHTINFKYAVTKVGWYGRIVDFYWISVLNWFTLTVHILYVLSTVFHWLILIVRHFY